MIPRPLLFALLFTPLACTRASDADLPATEDDTGEASSSSSGPIAAVGFYDDVAPILAEHCNGCHRDGGVAPFPLTSYADASAWSASILAAI